MVRSPLLAVVVAAVAGIVVAQPASTARGQHGGILRIGFSPEVGFDSVDPALANLASSRSLLEATCARLYTYSDWPSSRSFDPQPEVAAGYSRSADLKTYTFTLRPGFRFSSGEAVRATAFRHAINRALRVGHSPGALFMRDIVGADDVRSGRATTARGVEARGNTLVVRLTRPAPDFVARTALPFFCAVPPSLPVSTEGRGTFPSAGPYYVKAYRAAEAVVIRRNRFYGGKRKLHLDGFNVDLRAGNPVDLLRSIGHSEVDWGYIPAGVFATPGLDFEAKYELNRSRFHVRPGLTLRLLAFNSARPLFRNNPRLRRAVNFALDRRALVASSYGSVLSTASDQLIPHGMPGFRDVRVYPLRGDLERARDLARSHLRGAKAVLYVEADFQPAVETAQLVKEQLARIGLEVEIKRQAGGAEYQAQLTKPGEEWDIAFAFWPQKLPDAYTHLGLLLKTWLGEGETLTRATAALDRAARLPPGRARDLAYAELDRTIAHDVAPVAVLGVLNEATLVSKRVGCLVLRPALDLAAACLRA
jgi:ABC-type transport system substrate-binding protein